jgi:hypothetical protein
MAELLDLEEVLLSGAVYVVHATHEQRYIDDIGLVS